jgi:protein-arginine deiminase
VVQSDAVAVVLPIPEQRFPHVSDSTADLLGGIHIAETCTVGIRLHGDTEVESVPTLSIEVDDRAKGKVQLFMKVTSGWMDLGCDGVWLAALGEPDRESAILGIVARACRGASDQNGIWDGQFALTISAGIRECDSTADRTLPFAVAPFLLASSLDPVEEVLVVSNNRTRAFVDSLSQIIPLAGAMLRPVEVDGGDEYDVWVQDAVKIGRMCAATGKRVLQAVALLGGIRSFHDGINPKPLDSAVSDLLRKRRAIAIPDITPRTGTRSIDWYGNLLVSPPAVDDFGRPYPYGRILTGSQTDLGMHPDVLAFLEAQSVQAPALVIDTSWLRVGHVDEVVSFIPASSPPGFRVLMPSTRLALRILGDLRLRGYDGMPLFRGKGKRETTVGRLLDNETILWENTRIQTALDQTRVQLRRGLGLRESDLIELPALFARGLSLLPNFVNSLIINGHALLPAPVGPEIDGEDVFARWVGNALHPFGLTVHFVDSWDAYHLHGGGIHCGTNCIRRFSNVSS